jgi:hypothetical protein
VASALEFKQEMSPIDIAGMSSSFATKDSAQIHDLVSLSVRALIQVYDSIKSVKEDRIVNDDTPYITSVYDLKERLSPFEHVSITPTLT